LPYAKALTNGKQKSRAVEGANAPAAPRMYAAAMEPEGGSYQPAVAAPASTPGAYSAAASPGGGRRKGRGAAKPFTGMY